MSSSRLSNFINIHPQSENVLLLFLVSTHFNKIKRSSEKLFIHSFPIVSVANWFGLSSKKSFFFAINFASFFNSLLILLPSQQDFFVCDWIVPIRLDFYAYSTFQSWIAFASISSRSLSHFWWWRIKEYWLDDISSLFLLCFYLSLFFDRFNKYWEMLNLNRGNFSKVPVSMKINYFQGVSRGNFLDIK